MTLPTSQTAQRRSGHAAAEEQHHSWFGNAGGALNVELLSNILTEGWKNP